MTLRARQVAAGLLLVVGVEAWLTLGDGIWGNRLQLWLLLIAVAAWAVPPMRRVVGDLLERIRHPSARASTWASLVVSLVAGGSLLLTAHLQHRYLGPSWHDQFCYLIQARILGRGRLWMPAHPLGDFFESFYLITSPVYTPMYFPGAALMFAPAVKLGLPIWVTPLIACSMSAGLLYRIVTELIDGAAALLAVVLLLATREFRWGSMALMGQAPMLLLGMLILWAWLRWRRSGPTAWRWELLIGALAGWAAITRPLDAVCFALPVFTSMCIDWVRRVRFSERGCVGNANPKSEARNPKQIPSPNFETASAEAEPTKPQHTFTRAASGSLSPVLRGEGGGEGSVDESRQSRGSSSHPSPQPSPLSTGEREPDASSAAGGSVPVLKAACVFRLLIALLPFVALQLVFDFNITGHLFETPYGFYSERDIPGTTLGFDRFDPSAHPVSELPQKRQAYESYQPTLLVHRLDRIPSIARERLAGTLQNTLPQALVILWMPLCVLALDRRRVVMCLVWPMFVALYLPHPGFAAFYSVVAIPSALLAALLGARALESAWPRWRRGIGVLSTLLLLALAAGALPEVDRTIFDDAGGRPYLLEQVNAALKNITHPAVVLFTYPADGTRPVDQEPVYNTDTAWPDDARIVRANDLGTENARLFEYYARVQPEREVYRYDESDGKLEYLGTARELARRNPATR